MREQAALRVRMRDSCLAGALGDVFFVPARPVEQSGESGADVRGYSRELSRWPIAATEAGGVATESGWGTAAAATRRGRRRC